MSHGWTFYSSAPIVEHSAPPFYSSPAPPSALLPPQQVTFPHLLHQYASSPHLPPLPPPPQDLFDPPPGPGLEEADWSAVPCLLGGDGSCYQDQSPVHLQDPSTQQLYGTHTHFFSPPAPDQDPWGPLQLTLPQPQGYHPAGAPQPRWGSVEDFPGPQFLHDAPQPFSSPTTPGPSPHYPQTPTVPVPGAHLLDGPGPQGLLESFQDLVQDSGFFQGGTDLLQDLTDLLDSAGGGGGGEPGLTWGKPMEPERSTEALESRLLCLVCKRSFKSLPALNGHMRSHRNFRSGVWLKKADPVSMPVQSRGALRGSRRGRRRSGTGSDVLYRSLMSRDGEEGGVASDGRHYTPPPMLCPVRAGPGLFCSLPTRGRQRAQTVQLHNGLDGLDEALGAPPPGETKPRINVGRDFQADIPSLRSRTRARSDSHHALLLWTPWEALECPGTQKRVEALLMMAQSSVVAGGGVSLEETLHVLSESRGDFLVALDKLLSTCKASGVSWSAAEKRLLLKSLQLHHKNFRRIQETVKTKSLSECVAFYYLWKKKMNLKASSGGEGPSSSGLLGAP